MPLFGLVRLWLFGLLAVGLLVLAGYLFWRWADALPDPRPQPAADAVLLAPTDDPNPPPSPPTFAERLSAWRPGWDGLTALFAGAVALSLLGVGGGRGLAWLIMPKRGERPTHDRPGQHLRVSRPDGSELHVEITGRTDGPTVVFTHGWGATATEWGQIRRHLADRYRLVSWDLRGLGRSNGPKERNFGIDRMTDDLRAVLDAVGGGPAVLVGHSIGGMILLNLAKLHPEELGGRVAGLVLSQTTHTNPTHTTKLGGFLAAIQKPVLEPLAWLMVVFSPLVWVMNALSYLNGSAHWSNYQQVFSWAGTWGQVEFATRYVLWVWPAAYARGALGMFKFHATDALNRVTVPTLVITADRDTMTVPAASETIRGGIPGAELITLSPSGHMGPIQQADNTAAAVRSFLDRHLPAT